MKQPPLNSHLEVGTFPSSLTYSRYALALLIAVNLHNYTVRQIHAAVFPLIKADLHLSDAALGFLGSVFLVC